MWVLMRFTKAPDRNPVLCCGQLCELQYTVCLSLSEDRFKVTEREKDDGVFSQKIHRAEVISFLLNRFIIRVCFFVSLFALITILLLASPYTAENSRWTKTLNFLTQLGTWSLNRVMGVFKETNTGSKSTLFSIIGLCTFRYCGDCFFKSNLFKGRLKVADSLCCYCSSAS